MFDGGKNIYSAGLSLKDGKIQKIKIYNKIYEHFDAYVDFLLNFGGEECLKYYTDTKEWKKLYPGFSGFTVGVEFNYDSEGKIKLNHGFGFKDFKEGVLTFNAYYVNENREIIDHEIYDYILSSSFKKTDTKMQTHFIEAKRANSNDFCFCPLISHSNVTETEDNVRHSLCQKNKKIFDFIKDMDKKYFILNYGRNEDCEKIYLISNKNKEIENLIYLLDNVSEFIENLPLDEIAKKS
jgi:hypothetical protein